MKVGVFPGKFWPPHRGHLTSILKAHALCDRLYVVVSHRAEEFPGGALRKQWLCQELQAIDGIKVVTVDETPLPAFPLGWSAWALMVIKAVDEPFHVIFGGEDAYKNGHAKHFVGVDYHIIDPSRSQWPISGTEVRDAPLKHWNYIVGSARPYYSKKVLITGTESCGKTTLTKKLAKIFDTSWSEEVGRYYASRYLGGDETALVPEDFDRIGHLQFEQDLAAISTANRICFFDTDAVVTEYYCEIFTGKQSPHSARFIDPSKYDLVLFMAPSVPWVSDGQRFLSDQGEREAFHSNLYQKYLGHGFGPSKFIFIDSPYFSIRLDAAISAINALLS